MEPGMERGFLVLPKPPDDGGVLVLNAHQFRDKELRAFIARQYPMTKVIETPMLSQ